MHPPYSLYLHIPFCIHRCAYCDFNTYAGLESLIEPYTQALVQEIEYSGQSAAAYHGGSPLPLHTVFFGGGTPSLLPAAGLAQILQAIRRAYELSPQAEISLEANPGTLSLEVLQQLHALGVNRLSLGMQSANPEELQFLERQHGLQDVIHACGWARQAGLENFNLDLIFGLPGQSLESWQASLDTALTLRPPHLSLYALTIEHGTPLAHRVANGLVSEPDPDLAAEMYEHAQEKLAVVGYTQYEISNWALPSTSGLLSCRHNLQYWRGLPYLGLGAGAHGYAAAQRSVTVLAPAAYIQRLAAARTAPLSFPRTPASSEIRVLTPQDELGEYMMMRLRLVQEGVPEDEFQARFGHTLEETFPNQIRRLLQTGLIEWNAAPGGRCLRLAPRAYLLGNRVFREFI